MHLSDQDIEFFRQTFMLDIEPWNPTALQPASYDLHIQPTFKYQIMSIGESGKVDNALWIESQFTDGTMTLWPDSFILLSTIETVSIDASLAAQVAGKSTWARKGLVVESAGWVDPGFTGQLTLEVKNIGRHPIILTEGDSLAQIVFVELRTRARTPYGTPGLGSRYQNQTGPTEAR